MTARPGGGGSGSGGPSSSSSSSLSLRRHILRPLAIAALCHVACIHTIDSPKAIHHCPLPSLPPRLDQLRDDDDFGVVHRQHRHDYDDDWSSWDEGCYWSDGYAEAREKFVALGNAIGEQVRLSSSSSSMGAAGGGGGGSGSNSLLDVVDVRSLSYDISPRDDFFPTYLDSLGALDNSRSSRAISPGRDTVDALLLTLRLTDDGNDDDNNDDDGRRRRREGADVVHSSGTHGVEGYLGSAVQIRFLHELFMENERRRRLLPPHAEGGAADGDAQQYVAPSPTSSSSGRTRKVLLIHAVNPYGMRHHRRTNENNVDLNRNALDDETWANIRKRDPNFVGYVDMDSMLNPFVPPPLVVSDGGDDDDGEEKMPLFSWVDAARKGGFEGDVTKLREQDERVRRNAVRREDRGDDSRENDNIALGSHEDATSAGNDDPIIGSWLEEKADILRTIASVVEAVLSMGYTNAKRAMVSSQYHKPSGIFLVLSVFNLL